MRSQCGAWPRPSGSVAAVSDEHCSPSHGSRSLGRAVVGLLGPTPARTPLYDTTGWSTLEDWEIYANDDSAQFQSRRPDPVSCARTPTRSWWLGAGIAAVMRTSSAASSTTRSQRTRPPWIHSHALPDVTRRGEPGRVLHGLCVISLRPVGYPCAGTIPSPEVSARLPARVSAMPRPRSSGDRAPLS